MTSALGLDLGASGIRAWQVDSVEPIQVDAAAPENDRHAQAVLLATEVSEILKSNYQNVCFGLSGFSSLNVDKQKLAEKLAELFAAEKVIVTSDMVTPHYSHFGESDGIVAAVGTGTLFFGVNGENQARIDGLGAMLGDNGSAYWIGREALRRSSRQFELGNQSWLIDRLQQMFGSYSQWPKKFASGELKTFEIAQLSKLVAKGAEQEDSLSLEIIDQAAELIAESIIALSKKLAVDDVALTGGVLKSKLILERVTKLLEQNSLHSTLMSGSAVMGSFQLAKHFDSPRIRFLESQQQLFRWEG
ncbi:MAG TPA: BadF/BadG/BcrA/BcrD ATPase family protein [Microbacteriaceae bacterium]